MRSAYDDDMSSPSDRPLTRRERTHAATVEEIKDVARRHVAELGGASLNLRAVARDMGMTPSALYRYFASRDAMITALIIDSYDDLGDAVEAVAASLEPDAEPVGSFLTLLHVFRSWALAHPHEWALLYGGPVPGYEAPQATIAHKLRTTSVLLDVLGRDLQRGVVHLRPSADALPPRLRTAMRTVWGDDDPCSETLPAVASAGALACWCTLLGAVAAEVFGHLPPAVHGAAKELFEHTMVASLAEMGFDLAPWRAASAR